MIILYTFSKKKHQYVLDWYLNTFLVDFKLNILKYRRCQGLLGRVLLQLGLKSCHINEVLANRLLDNKAYLKDQYLHFNITHSKKLAICAIIKFPENQIGNFFYICPRKRIRNESS